MSKSIDEKIAAFIADRIEFTGKSDDRLETKEIFEEYARWSGNNQTRGRNRLYSAVYGIQGVKLVYPCNAIVAVGIRFKDEFSDLI